LNTSVALLAVLEVDENSAIRCQSPGCNHHVFKSVHVLRSVEGFALLGSSCFKKLYRGKPESKLLPLYTPKSGRRLTSGEQSLLAENTQTLVTRLERAWLLQCIEAASLGVAPGGRRKTKTASTQADPLFNVPPELIAAAKRQVAADKGVDPNLPGWRSFVVDAVKNILRQHAA
jgi:hypothetical protein